MKKAYCIWGMGGTGKTRGAGEISRKLKIPVYQMDNITNEEKEGNAQRGYQKIMDIRQPDLFILEGGDWYLDKTSTEIVLKLINHCSLRYIYLYPSYERWLENLTLRAIDIKRNKIGFQPTKLNKNTYYLNQNILLDEIRKKFNKNIWVIKDTNEIIKPLIHGDMNYQNNKRCQNKWPIFNFPQDMKGKSFFEIGCNQGYFLKKAHEQGADVYGTDIYWQLLDKCLDELPGATLDLCCIEKYIFKRKYDFILCSSAFHFFKNKETIIEKISKATDYFILETPVFKSETEKFIYPKDLSNKGIEIPSKKWLLEILNKHFDSVEEIGETTVERTCIRPVFKCKNK